MKRLFLFLGILFVLAFPEVGRTFAQIGQDHITAHVFLDSRCDNFYNNRRDISLVNVPVLFDNQAAPQIVNTSSRGHAWIGGFDATAISTTTVSVVLPTTYKGYVVELCFNQPSEYHLTPEDFSGFNVRFHHLRFRATLTLP